jgi:hypothetical protein
MDYSRIANKRLRIFLITLQQHLNFSGLIGTKYEREIRAIEVEMLKRYEAHNQKMRTAGLDPNKSDSANALSIEDLQNETHLKIQNRRNNIKEHYLEHDEKEIKKIVKGNDSEFSDHREIEMRGELKAIKPLELTQRYLSANRDGTDPLLIQAVEGAPKPFSLVADKVVENGKMLRIERLYPGVIAKRKTIQKAEELAMRVIDAVDQAI